MKHSYWRTLFAVGLVSVAAGCRRSNEPAVAHIGPMAITVADFQSRLREAPAAYQQYAATPEGRRQFLTLMIREKVLLAESRKAGLQKNENYQKAVDQFKEKARRDTKDYEESLLVQMYLAHLRSKDLSVTDADIRKYYDDHKADFDHPVEVDASHILVNSSEDAEKVIARLKNGESFEALARSISLDPPTAARGGKLGPFTKGSLMPEFEQAVFALKDGQVSAPVKTSFGYHVIKKTGQKALPAKSFEQVKDDIQARMQREKFDQWITQAQSALGVKIDEQALATASLAAQPGMPSPAQESLQ
jgi:peptidyl-prolyl cis-trans isomerase C